MQPPAIIDVLARELGLAPAAFEAAESADGMPTLYVPRERIADTCVVLRDAPVFRFAFLADIVAVDYHPRVPRFELVYLMACPGSGVGTAPARLRVKVRVNAGESVPTASGVWTAANWAEREVYDFFGITFDGHPDLRRILMPEDWEGFPMRKDYPVQIKQPVKTYAPLQVSEEQFVASIEKARSRSRNE